MSAKGKRSTNEIIIAIKDNEPVTLEELRLACLVLDAQLFFAHNNIKRLIAGGTAAEVTKKLEFPGAYGQLGISESEFKAMKMDPAECLGPSHIPGTPEYEAHYSISKKIFEKAMSKVGEGKNENYPAKL